MENQNNAKSNKSLNAVFKRQPLYVKLIVMVVFSVIITVLTVKVTVLTFFGKHLVLNAIHKQVFTGVVNKPEEPSSLINYDYPFQNEEFFVYVPRGYEKRKSPYGLVVNINAVPLIGVMPDGWQAVLDKRNLLFISPFYAGNDRKEIDRTSLAVLSALLMKRDFDIDPKRIYISGLSGGARMACITAFLQSDIFKGTIQSCGANFVKPIKFPHGRGLDTMGNPYVFKFYNNLDEISKAKERVKFSLITGPSDFRRFEVLAIYDQGFSKENYKCKLFDIPEMGHENCTPATLEKVLDYLDGKTD